MADDNVVNDNVVRYSTDRVRLQERSCSLRSGAISGPGGQRWHL